MKYLSVIIAFLLTVHYSCGQKTKAYKPESKAVELNNQTIALIDYLEIPDSLRKAITLLDKATTIDSNYFLGYFNKIMFLVQLKQFDKAIATNNKLITLEPLAHDLYLQGGGLYEQVGDTVSSIKYFKKSLEICNAVLDTMNKLNRDFNLFKINQAVSLIMLNDSTTANKILNDLYESIPDEFEFENVEKEYIKSLINKTKTQLLDFFIKKNQVDVNATMF